MRSCALSLQSKSTVQFGLRYAAKHILTCSAVFLLSLSGGRLSSGKYAD